MPSASPDPVPVSGLVEVELNSLAPNRSIQPTVTETASPSGDGSPSVEVVNPNGYLDLLGKLRAVWKDQPDVSISWSDLAYTVQVPKTDTRVQTLATAFAATFTKPFQGTKAYITLKALQPSNGVIAPGSMTLVLAPPGHGKTTLLKALAGRLDHDKNLTGEILFNGRSKAENRRNGVFVNRLCAYVGQTDLLFPTLTVHETLDFSAKNAIADPKLLHREGELASEKEAVDEVVALEKRRAELLIDMLGLRECADTIVGNDLLRGVSGGQRKRTALGEMLITNARAYMLDEVTTGLDAAVTLHIFSALKKACAINNAAVVTALLQPTPETYALFDNVIVMRDGYIVYHGPRVDLPKWLWETTGLEVPNGTDEAGFIVDYLTDPKSQYDLAEKLAAEKEGYQAGRTVGLQETSAKRNISNLNTAASSTVGLSHVQPERNTAASPHHDDQEPQIVTFHLSGDQPGQDAAAEEQHASVPAQGAENASLVSKDRLSEPAKQLKAATSSVGQSAMYHSKIAASPVVDSAELYQRWAASTWFSMLQTEIHMAAKQYQPLDTSRWSAFSLSQYGRQFPHSTATHARMTLHRQWLLTSRNRTMIPPRMTQAVLFGFIQGSIFWQLADSDYAARVGVCLLTVMSGAFSNLTEVPVASEARNVVAKQIDAGFFPASSYTLSVCLMHFPVTIVETVILSLLTYWISGFAADAGRFFFFLLIVLLNNNCLGVFFRSIAYYAKNPDIARQMDLPWVIIFLVFGGFLITRDHIPNWLIEFYYFSPFAWSVQSLVLNEFNDAKYDVSPNHALIFIHVGDSCRISHTRLLCSHVFPRLH